MRKIYCECDPMTLGIRMIFIFPINKKCSLDERLNIDI